MSDKSRVTSNAVCPVADERHVVTAGLRSLQLLQDVSFRKRPAHFDRESGVYVRHCARAEQNTVSSLAAGVSGGIDSVLFLTQSRK